jgi:hypothetical protein
MKTARTMSSRFSPHPTLFAERTVLSTSSVRGLRISGYPIMATLIVMPFAELGVRTWPFRLHSPAWRVGFLGAGSAALVTPLLALYLTFAIAAVADDRVVEYLVAGLAAAAAVICGGAATLFSLDALQMKGQVSAAAASQYDIGSMWVVARLLVVAVLFIVLAASSMRTARSAPHKPSAVLGRGGGQVLIRTTPPGTAAQRGVDVEGG